MTRTAHLIAALSLIGCTAGKSAPSHPASGGSPSADDDAVAATVAPTMDATGSDAAELDADPLASVVELPASTVQTHGRVVAGVPTWLDGRAAPFAPEGADFQWLCSDGTKAAGALAEVTFEAAGAVSCALLVTAPDGSQARTERMVDVHDTVAQWTVMVFVNGDNNLEAAGLNDFDEMEQAISAQLGGAEDVQLVVQLDRSDAYADRGDDDWSGARRYVVGADRGRGIDTPHLEDLGSVDSGDWTTVSDFVAWSADHFPSERTALVIWNHGGGWKSVARTDADHKAISDDESTGNSISVANGELEELLVETTAILEGPLDLLGMDACLMQTFEVAWTAAPYADVLVASQELEDGDGWAYDTAMADLLADPSMDGAGLGERIAVRFHETKDDTQSVIDLSGMDDVATALDGLAKAMLAANEDTSALFQAAKEAAWASSHADYAYNVDLIGLAEGIADRTTNREVATAAEAVVDAVDAAVLVNLTSGRRNDGASGMSIYTGSGRELHRYTASEWGQALLWDELIHHVNSED